MTESFAKQVLRMAAEANCNIRLATNMKHVELQEGEVAIADDGFIIIVEAKKLKIAVENWPLWGQLSFVNIYFYSTVTDFAKFLGLSTSNPFSLAI